MSDSVRDDDHVSADAILERIGDPVVALDREQRVTYANERARAVLEATDAGLVGTPFGEVVGETSATDAASTVDEALETGQYRCFEQFDDTGQLFIQGPRTPRRRRRHGRVH